ncbi:hypothetical protein ASZ78_016583, partial [Callipepla squamata]
NGLPSPSKSYVFNGDFVDRGKQSLEILIILFTFLLIYPKEVHLNRGNHEDHMVNLRYGFTKEVMQKYKTHGKKILKMIQNVFCWLPLATLIDQKVLVIHGGVSDTTDLDMLEKIQRNKVGFISWMLQEKSVLLVCSWRAYTCMSAWLLTREICQKDGLRSQKVCLGTVLEGIDFV